MTRCRQLKQVFFGHGREGVALVGNGIGIIIPQLRVLRLIELPNFMSLFPRDNYSTWPSLQELIVERCAQLIPFFIEDMEANVCTSIKVVIYAFICLFISCYHLYSVLFSVCLINEA